MRFFTVAAQSVQQLTQGAAGLTPALTTVKLMPDRRRLPGHACTQVANESSTPVRGCRAASFSWASGQVRVAWLGRELAKPGDGRRSVALILLSQRFRGVVLDLMRIN